MKRTKNNEATLGLCFAELVDGLTPVDGAVCLFGLKHGKCHCAVVVWLINLILNAIVDDLLLVAVPFHFSSGFTNVHPTDQVHLPRPCLHVLQLLQHLWCFTR